MSENTLLTGSVVILLEAEERFVAPVSQALQEIDPQLQVLVCQDVNQVIQALQKNHPQMAPDAEIKLMILMASPETKPDNLKQISGISALPTVVVTSFEHFEKLVRDWSSSGVFNLIQKPYDELLLKQHLKMALHPGETPKDFTTYNMKTSAVIEMLKEVPMERISEVGIVTRSDREVPIGRVTKFYGRSFLWNQRMSVYTRSLECRPHSKDPQEKSVLMTWFGIGREQMLQIRGRFPQTESPLEWRPSLPSTSSCGFLVLGDPSPEGSDLAGTLSRQFSNIEIQSYAEIPGPNVPLPRNLKAVLVHRGLLDVLNKDPRFEGLPRILLATTTPNEDELRADAHRAIDVVSIPTERVSFFKRMAVLFPELQPSESLTIRTFENNEMLDVGQPIQITEMSETGLTMKYERALPIGTIRRFVLWLPMELGLPILTARCYLSRTDASGGILNYFNFFGMSDAEIKHVRVWMRDCFIQENSKDQ